MNILIASTYLAPFGGNFIGSLQDLSIRIKERGDNVVFLFPKLQEGERPWVQWLRDSGYKVILADLSLSAQQQMAFLRTVLDDNKIDIVHLHFEIYAGLLLRYPEVFAKRKVLIHDHMGFSTGVSRVKQRIALAIISAVYSVHGYGVATVSKQKKNAYIFLLKKWHVPNGLSMKRNVDRFFDRDETRRDLGIGDDQKLVTLLGWAMKRKGVDIASKAVSRLREEGMNVVLGLVGGSIDKYDPFLRQYGIDPESPWIKYINSREDIYSLHRASDTFLSASRDEGFSYAILEAISQETPVVMSDIPETNWAAEYEKCSVFPVEDDIACAEAIKRSLSCGRERSNADAIVDRYSIGRWCDSVLDKYDRMIRKK